MSWPLCKHFDAVLLACTSLMTQGQLLHHTACRCKIVGPTLGFIGTIVAIVVCWPIGLSLCFVLQLLTSSAKLLRRFPLVPCWLRLLFAECVALSKKCLMNGMVIEAAAPTCFHMLALHAYYTGLFREMKGCMHYVGALIWCCNKPAGNRLFGFPVTDGKEDLH